MSVDAYRRTTIPYGVTLNYRTLEMLTAAVRNLSFPISLSQGSYSSGVSQSAGTHDGGGALDVRAVPLSSNQRDSVVYQLRRVGFAAWLRTPSQGDWPYHIHAIAVGDQDLSPGAKAQVVAYNNGRNGLASNGPDDGPRQFVGTVHSQELYMSFYGPEHWDSDDWKQFRAYVHGSSAGTVDRGVPYQDLTQTGSAADSSPQKLAEYARKTTKETEDKVDTVDGKVTVVSGKVTALDAKVQALVDHFGIVP